jgi:hypothetical protein
VLCWHTKIEEFSLLDVIGPPQYSSQQLFKASLPGYSGSGCELVEPTEVSNEERDEVYFSIKNTLVCMMKKFGMY